MTSLVLKVKEFLIKQVLLKPGEKLAIAVSGGPDSVAMLYCLNSLKNDLEIELSVFHINHMLRGEESDRDETFVQNLVKSLGLPFYSARVDVAAHQKKHKCSIQVAAREMRYLNFDQLADQFSISKIATGHTADDQAETVLMKTLKGSGLKGIAGIPPIRDNKYIRPLLKITRDEIEQFLEQNQIKFQTDSTNLENNYLRNQIKNTLIPYLKKEFNPSIIETLCRSSQIFRAEDDYISEITRNEFNKLLLKNNEETLVLDATYFQTLHTALRRRIILDAVYKISSSGRQISQNIIENILQVIAAKISGKSISVFNDLICKYQYNQIIFEFKKESLGGNLIKRRGAVTEWSYRSGELTEKTCSKNKFLQSNGIKQKNLLIPGKTKIEETGKEIISTVISKKDIPKDLKKTDPFTAFIDYSVSGKKLFIRSRQKGDKFCPLGIKGHKKIKDYFIDRKIPREERDFIPLVTNKESIIWIIGHQISEFASVKEHTRDVLMLEVY